MLQWENTDQFGNLKVATSSATSLENVKSDLDDMVKAVFEQHGREVAFSIDVPYAEISAPRGDQVSHLLNLPFVSVFVAGGMDKSEIQKSLTQQLKSLVGDTTKVVGPWD
jgi:hypothetical protein